MIHYTSMNKTCLGEINDGIDSMIDRKKTIINMKKRDHKETFFKQVHTIIEFRWNTMTTLLHLLAFALHPNYYCAKIILCHQQENGGTQTGVLNPQ